MLRLKYIFTLNAILLTILFGCSSNTLLTQTAPEINENLRNDSHMPVHDSNSRFIKSEIGLLGVYELNLDIEKSTAELVSKRYPSIGESYLVSGLGFFTRTPCTDCLKIKEIDIQENYWDPEIIVRFLINHPFPRGNTSLPPSASNRLDLDVFDPALIIVPRDRDPEYYPLTGKRVQSHFCWNPDGFTSELNDLINDNDAYPYFLVIDNADTGVSTNNRFAMGTINKVFDTFFHYGGTFNLYLTMGYGFSAKKADRLTPKYYLPEFNRKSAWKVEVIPPHGDDIPPYTNTWTPLNTTTQYPVTVRVFDWQQNAPVCTDPSNYDDAPVSLVYAESNVARVSVEIPGMFNTLKIKTTPDSGSGTPANPLVYTFMIANENGLAASRWYDDHIGLVKVTDQRLPLNPYQGRDFLIDSPDGIALNNYTISEYATYQVFPAIVAGNL